MNGLFQKNIDALKKFNPDIASQIENAEPPEELESYHPNILIKYKGGKLPIHDIANPEKKAKDTVQKYPFLKNDLTVVIGTGGGYLLHQLLKKKDKQHYVLVVEPVAYFLKMIFEKYNLEKWILNSTLYFLVDVNYLSGAIAVLETAFVIEEWQTIIEDYIPLLPEYYNDIVIKVMMALNQVRCNTGTMMGAGLQIAINDISNLPYIIKNRGVVDLKDAFKGKPAVCISTGPSLKKNLWRLKGMEGKVVIIAVAQALRTLLGYGIRPDFITTVDFGDINYEHFKGVMDEDVPLVCLNRTYYKILKEYQGSKFIVSGGMSAGDETSTGVIAQKGFLEQGGSVAHFSFGLALFMGCNPITFIGQDLSYDTGNKSHTDTADASGGIEVDPKDGMIYWKVTDPRSKLYTGERIPMGPAQYVPGYMGGMVLTNIGLLSFVNAFEQIIKFYPDTKTYNSTEGGAYIKGAERISLKSFLETFCKKKIDKLDESLLTLSPEGDKLIEETIPKLEKDIKDLEELQKLCDDAMETNVEMSRLDHGKDKDELIRITKRNFELSSKAHEIAKRNPLVTSGIYNESRQILGKELADKGPRKRSLGTEEDLKIGLKRNKLILDSAKKAVEQLLPEYKKTLEILNKYIETKDEAVLVSKDSYSPSLNDAEKFIESGNWATPMLDASKIILGQSSKRERIKAVSVLRKTKDMRNKELQKAKSQKDNTNTIRYIEMVYQIQQEGFGKKQIDEKLLPGFIEKLKEARRLNPNGLEARWGLATCYHHMEDFEKSLKEYKTLVKDFPDFPKLKFEYGVVLLNTDSQKGRKIISEVMEKTQEFDFFLASMGKVVMMEGKWDLAKEYYKMYLEKFPQDTEALKAIEKCLVELKDEVGAKSYRKQIEKIEGKS